VVEVTVEKLIYGGLGLAHDGGRALFIPLAAPGDRLRVRIIEEKKGYAIAAIEEVLEFSTSRREPPCPYYGICGGCQLQHLSYPAQLQAKVDFIRESLSRIGGIERPHLIQIIHGQEFNYRLRAELKLRTAGDHVQFGYYRPASHDLCEIDHCPLLSTALNDALDRLRAWPAPLFAGTQTIDLAQGQDGQIVTYPLVERNEISEVCWQVDQFTYWFDAQAFFQVNQFLLQDMLKLVVEGEEGDRALDLFCGVGFFSIPLAGHFKTVIGVESDQRAIWFAARNAADNQATNCRLEADSVEHWFVKKGARLESMDLVVVDPPRAGLSKRTAKAVVQLKPERVTYVSCNPTTLARDLKWFLEGGYTISAITALDLFPQTFHVETIVKLHR
jgi:23S rRNA (uracil1939-C5)-methyltransferase